MTAESERRVLVLTADGVQRDPIRKALQREGLKVDFISDANMVLEAIGTLKPNIFLHDLESIDADQGIILQQRFAKMSEMAELCRIIYAAKITPKILALASDTGVRRVLTQQSVQINLIEEINMAISAEKSIADLQKKVRQIQSNATEYSQAEIDEIVEQAYNEFPHDKVAKLEYGNLLYRDGNYEDTKVLAYELVEADANNVRAMGLLSRVFMKSGEFDEAQKILEKANILSPKNTDRLLALGDVCLKKGHKDRAREYYKEAVDASGGDKDVVSKVATFEILEGNINDALEIFKQTLSEEETAGLLNNAGIQAVREKNFLEAIKYYDLAINSLQTNRFLPQILFNMSLAQRRVKNTAEAIKFCKRALKYDPDFEKAQRQLELLLALEERKKRKSA